MPNSHPTPSAHWPAFRYPDFRLFWFGALVSRAGSWIHNAAVPFALFQMTHAPVWVGAAGFAFLFPQMVTSIPGGHWADRSDRRQLLIVFHVLMFIAAAALALSWASGVAGPWCIFLLTALLNALVGFQMPAAQTLSSEIVDAPAVANAIHLNVVALQAARAMGPLLGGFILATWGVGWAFAVDAISYLFALITLLLVTTSSNGHDTRTDITDSPATLRETWRLPGVVLGVTLTAFVGFLGPPVVQLSTLFAARVFHVDAHGYGTLMSVYGVGSLTGAIFLSLVAHRYQRHKTIAVTVLWFGAALVLLGSMDAFAGGLVAMALAGVAFSISLGSLNAGVQALSPLVNRGKVIALYLIALNAGAAFGSFTGAWLCNFTTPSTVVTVAGTALAVIGIACFTQRRFAVLDA